jgi:hypothetical protein
LSSSKEKTIYNFDSWSADQLLNLKEQTQQALNKIHALNLLKYKCQFNDGERVYAKYKDGSFVFGNIVRVSRKNIRVKFDTGVNILLPPNAIYKIDNSVFKFENVVPFKQKKSG